MRRLDAPQTVSPCRALSVLAVLAMILTSAGCEVNSFFDPSRTGRFTFTPTTMPILTRIDAIEPGDDLWGQTTSVEPADLVPSDLSYRIVPGDMLQIEIYELYQRGEFFPFARRVDQSGNVSVPEIGLIRAAGMTAQQFKDELAADLAKSGVGPVNPTVSVDLQEGGAFTYTIHGHIGQAGRFTLQDPNLRLIDALAMAGGPPLSTTWVYVIRQVHLSDELLPHYERERKPDSSPRQSQQRSGSSSKPGADKAVDIESLIDQLNNNRTTPGAWMPQDEPIVDIDDVMTPQAQSPQGIDVDDLNGSKVELPKSDNAFIYVPERKEWVRVKSNSSEVAEAVQAKGVSTPDLVLERVIKIPYQKLTHGDNSYNIVVRPSDQIYIGGPPVGIVYIDGEILRPGVYNLPTTNELTLSRLIAAAGGLASLAIPERVDLVREVGEHREATIRLNLAAIRRRTEPDIYLKPNDHIIIGTNFLAYPLAILRNGLRANYGFAFLLDRNFGNDVFGPPPVSF